MNWWQGRKSKAKIIARIDNEKVAVWRGKELAFIEGEEGKSSANERNWRHDSGDLVLILPAGTTHWHEEIVPQLSGQELASMAQWEMENWFPDLAAPAVDFLVERHGSTHQHIWAVAVDKRKQTPEVCATHIIGIPEEYAWARLLFETNAVVFYPLENSVLVVMYLQGKVWQRWLTSPEDAEETYRSVRKKVNELAREVGMEFVEYHVVAEEEKVRQEWLAIDRISPWRTEWAGWQEEVQGLLQCTEENLSDMELKILLAERESSATALGVGNVRNYILNVLLVVSLLWVGAEAYKYRLMQEEMPLFLQQKRELADWRSRNQELADFMAVQNRAQKQRLSWAKVLLVIADSRPANVHLEKIGSEGGRIVLTGFSPSTKAVQQWQLYLEKRLGLKGTMRMDKDKAKAKDSRQFVLHMEKENEAD